MNIKKGQKFLCKETVVMNHTGEVAYIKGKTYTSEQRSCITDEAGDIGHSWDWDTDFDWYFELIEEETKESLDEQLPTPEVNKHKGLRFNNGKLRYDLIHPIAQEGLVKVLTKGSEKYSPRNWEAGMSWSTVIASLKRHLAAVEKGEDYDPETGLLHVDHIQCNAHFLSAYYHIYPKGDDRRQPTIPKIGLDIDGVLADMQWSLCWYKNVEPFDPIYWDCPEFHKLFKEVLGDKQFWVESLRSYYENSSLPFEPHCYITSRSIPQEWTQEWLDKSGYPKAPLYSVNGSKVELAKQAGIDYFIDDSYKNFLELNNAGICTFLLTRSYNKQYNVGHKRIDSLEEFKERYL